MKFDFRRAEEQLQLGGGSAAQVFSSSAFLSHHITILPHRRTVLSHLRALMPQNIFITQPSCRSVIIIKIIINFKMAMFKYYNN